jgi:hypothetical protein
LPGAEADKITDVVKHGWCDQDQAVKTIQQSAVPWDEPGGVFETKITFDRREHQVPKLAYYADDNPKTNQADRIIQCGVNPNEMTNHCHERRRQNDRAERSPNGFVWTGVRNKFSMTEQMTADVGKDVIQFRRR